MFPHVLPKHMRAMPLYAALAASLALSACVMQTQSSSRQVPPPAPAETYYEYEAQTNAWVESLTGLSPAQQAIQAEAVWNDPANPDSLRIRAASILSTRPSAQSLAAQQYLANTYANGVTPTKTRLERLLTADLLTADGETLRLLANSVPRVQEATFPWSLTVWHAARRDLVPDSGEVLARLTDPALYADPQVVGLQARTSSGRTVVESTGPSSVNTALLLPLSGPYGSIGRQVAAGAEIAVESLARQGVTVQVEIIDTESAGWENRLSSLPADYAIVGGPLRAEHYSAAQASAMYGRALFAFLAVLPNPQDEGRTAWRFFTSPQDQVDAVLDFAMGSLGIYSYGVLSPDDAYGRRMTDIFSQAAAMRGVTVRTGTYPLEDMSSWTRTLGEFVQTSTPGRGQIPVARAPFDAIFLPDSWKNMDMVVSTLQYHGAHRKLILGTSLWEQGLMGARGINSSTFALSIFPAAWNPAATTPAATTLTISMLERGGQADDWSVLGYDFVRFASALGLRSPVGSAAEVNARLGAGLSLEWAGAPMSWDSQGRAHRRLFLFQPSRTGMVPLDQAAFLSYWSGSGPLPNAAPTEPVQPNMYDPEVLQPDLDALINSITGSPAPNPAAQW